MGWVGTKEGRASVLAAGVGAARTASAVARRT